MHLNIRSCLTGNRHCRRPMPDRYPDGGIVGPAKSLLVDRVMIAPGLPLQCGVASGLAAHTVTNAAPVPPGSRET
jgi:hypothetical protein